MGRNRGSRSGREGEMGNHYGEFVVSAGVTMDYSIVEKRRLTVIVRGVMRHAILKTDKVIVTGCFHGAVEASTLEVAKGALFVGKAMVHTATIGGRLEGILVAAGMLNMKASGHCDGVLRYGELNIHSGAQLTGAVKKASPADESIGEIPVPDLPKGTWDNHHRSSSINIKKRVTSMMGGEQSSRRGGYGPKRARGGPRILRSAGQTARSDSDFARQVAEYAFQEVTVGATASGVSGASRQRLGGEFKENEAVGIEGSRHKSIRMREGKRGDGAIESVPHVEGVPRPRGKARRVGDQTNRAGARAGMGANAAGGTSVGRENGESVGSKGSKVLLHHPPVDGSSPVGSDSEIDMMDFLEEAAQQLVKGETKEEGVDSGSYGDKNNGLVAEQNIIHITQEGLRRLKQAPQRRLGSTESVRMTSVPAVPAAPGATATVVPGSATAEEGTLTVDAAAAASIFVAPSNSGADRKGETVSESERITRAETPRRSAAAAAVAAAATSPVTMPTVMSRNLVDDRRLPAALLAAFAEVERGSFEEDKDHGERQEPVAPVPGSVGTRAGGVGQGVGFARTTAAAVGNVENSFQEDRAKGVQGGAGEQRDKSETKHTMATSLKNGFSNGDSHDYSHSNEDDETAKASPIKKQYKSSSEGDGGVEGAATAVTPEGIPPMRFPGFFGRIERADVSYDDDSNNGDGDNDNRGGGGTPSGNGRGGSEGGVFVEGSRDSTRGAAVETPESVPASVVAAAAAAVALRAGDTSLFNGPAAVLSPKGGAKAGLLPLPEARGFRVCGAYTEAAVAAVTKATSAVPAVVAAAEEMKDGHGVAGEESKVAAVLRTPIHGKLRSSGSSVGYPSPKGVYASPPHELVLGNFREGSSAKPNRSPPPGPSANTHRRQAAREREMKRGLRLLPATTTTAVEAFDRSKLPFSPTRGSRSPTGQAERRDWRPVPVQHKSTAAAAAEGAARGAAVAASHAAKVAERSARNNCGADFEWSRVGMFPLGSRPATGDMARLSPLMMTRSANAASSSTSTAFPSSGVAGKVTSPAPTSPIVSMPLVEDFARSVGRGKPPEEVEAEETWSVGMEALSKQESVSSSEVGSSKGTRRPVSPSTPAAPTPSSLNGGASPDTASAFALGLGVALSSAMASRDMGADVGSVEKGSSRVRSAVSRENLKAFLEQEEGEEEEDGSDAHWRWREVRDRSRESTGMGPAMMARQKYATAGPRSPPAGLERSALPTISQFRRKSVPTSPVNPLSPATKRFTESPSKPPRPISRALAMAQDAGDTGSRDLGSATAAAVAAAAAAAAEADDDGVIARVDQSKAKDEGVLAKADQSEAEKEGVLAKVDQSEAENEGVLAKVDQSEAENEGVLAKVGQSEEGNEGIERAVQSEQYAGVERGEDEAYADMDARLDFAVEGETLSATRLDTGEHSESAFPSAPGEAASHEFGGVVTGVRPEERMANGREEAIAVLDHTEGGGVPGDAEKCGVSAMALSTSEGPSASEAAVMSSGVDNGADGNAFADESVQSKVVEEGPTADHSLSEIAVPIDEPPVVDALHAERQEACESTDVSAVNAVPTAEVATADVVVTVADQTEVAVIEAEAGNQTEASDHVPAGQSPTDQTAVDQPKASEETEVGDKASAEEDVQGVAGTAAAAAEEAVSTAYEMESGAQSEPVASESVGPIATAPLETPPPQTTIDADMDVLVGAAEPADDAVELTSIEAVVTADAAKPTTFEVDATEDAAKPTSIEVDATANAAKPTTEKVDATADSAKSVAGLGGDKRVRISGEFPSTEGQRRSSAGDKSPRDRGLTAGKVEGKDLPRIRSEGGMVPRRTGVMIAGRPVKKQSGFVAPKDVRQGLGPAGAFTGNANWRVDAVREKTSSAADVRSDGHGGFHNPMAALRAQQQQQQQHNHVRVGRIAPAPGGSYTSSVVDAESVPSEGRSGVDEEGVPSVPAWMVNKGLITGGRNPSGVLLARPGRGRLHGGGRGGIGGSALRPSAGSVLGGRPSTAYGPLSGGRVGVGFGGGSGADRVQEAPTSPSAPSTNKEALSSPLANEEAPSSPLANEKAPSLPLIVEDAPSESGVVSSSRVPEKKESLEGKPLLDSSRGSAEVGGTTSVNIERGDALPGAGSSLPAADARDSKQSRTPRLSISSLPLATIIPTDDDSPLPGEGVEATHAGNHSGGFVNGGIGLSGGAPVKAGREVGNYEEVPLFGTELDSGAEFSGPGGEFLDHSSSPGASGGFAALGRFLFGSRQGSQHAQIAPGEEVEPGRNGGKPRDEESSVYLGGSGGTGGDGCGAIDDGGRNGIGGLLRGGSGGGGSSSSRGIGMRGSLSRSGESVSAAGSASNVSDHVGSASSSECTTAPTSSANGDADGDEDGDIGNVGDVGDGVGDVGDEGDGEVADTGDKAAVAEGAAAAGSGSDVPAAGEENEASQGGPAPPGVKRALNPSESPTSPFVDDMPPSPQRVGLSATALTVRENNDMTKTTAAKETPKAEEAAVGNEKFVEMAKSAASSSGGGGSAGTAAAAATVAGPSSGSSIVFSKPLTHGPGITSPLRLSRRVGSRPGNRAADSPSNRSSGSSNNSNITASSNKGSRPPISGAASLLSGERKTGLAALEHQGTTAKATRRALLEETRQRRAADAKPKATIFETLRQRSHKNASNMEKRNTLSGRRRPSSRSSLLAPSPRRASSRTREHSRRIDVVVETSIAPPPRSHGEARSGVTIEDDLEEVDDHEVDPGSDEEDEKPDFWSMYGVIDAAALDEDAEIEI